LNCDRPVYGTLVQATATSDAAATTATIRVLADI
jgi:hypothetical protein